MKRGSKTQDPSAHLEPAGHRPCQRCNDDGDGGLCTCCGYLHTATVVPETNLERLVERYHRDLLSSAAAGHARSHLRASGMTSDDLREKRLGWERVTDCLTIPVFADEGVLTGLLFDQTEWLRESPASPLESTPHSPPPQQ